MASSAVFQGLKRAAVVIGLLVLTGCPAQKPKPGPPDYGTLPAWSFIDETGAKLGSQELKGRPWAANFIFTACRSACPKIAAASKKLQDRMQQWLPKEGPAMAQIISITVDPVTDTPARLKDFAEGYQAKRRIWKFARGEYPEMEALVTKGFRQALERNDTHTPPEERIKNPTPIETAHSVHFVLVDAHGHIRGFFGIDEDSMTQLNAGLETLSRPENR